MKKKILCMLLAGITLISISGIQVSAASGDRADEIDPQLINKPVYSSMFDEWGNTYIAIGECYEAGSSVNIVGARTICEVDQCKESLDTVINKYKTVKVEGAGLTTLTGTMYIPDASRTATGRQVNVYSQITNAPYIKLSIGSVHRIFIGSYSWYGASTCDLIE